MNKTKKYLINFLIIIVFLIPTVIGADGGVSVSVEIESPEEEVNIPSQKAIIVWNGKKEVMSLSTEMRVKELTDLAWIIPVPSKTKPKVEEESAEIFHQVPYFFSEINLESKMGRKIDPLFFALPLILLFLFFRKKKIVLLGILVASVFALYICFVDLTTPKKVKVGIVPVKVLETKKVGVYDVMVLKATSADYLVNWLNQRGFKISEENIPILQEYCNKSNFYFIVNKISKEALSQKDLLEGIATPLKITFQPKQPFYPLKLSSINGGSTIIDVYLFSENPARDESNILSIKKSRETQQIEGLFYMSKNEEFFRIVEGFFSWYPLDAPKYPVATWLRYEGGLEGLKKDAYFKSDSIVCDNLPLDNIVGVKRDRCYEMLAESEIYPSFCDKISDQNKKQWCHFFKEIMPLFQQVSKGTQKQEDQVSENNQVNDKVNDNQVNQNDQDTTQKSSTVSTDSSRLDKDVLLHKLFPNVTFKDEVGDLEALGDIYRRLYLVDAIEDHFITPEEKHLLLIVELEGSSHAEGFYHAYLGLFDKNGNLITPPSIFPEGNYRSDKAHFGADSVSFEFYDCKGVKYILSVIMGCPNGSCCDEIAHLFRINNNGDFEFLQTIDDFNYAIKMRFIGDRIILKKVPATSEKGCPEINYKVLQWNKESCRFE
ncbi:MAG TPA: DUF2330 domain-containing protein [Candidatus Parcubacteria bacterium]|nr:DUF2330 domain-containing protein [Candidatus Parcubacteria bacterium]